MIISHRHRFIFLKTVKTAGTSVEISLSRYCGDEDIVTPVSPADEPIRRDLGIVPRHYLAPRSEYRWPDYYRLFVQGRKKLQFWNHITATETRARVGDRIWGSYFKFTTERNPWDKTISDFYWRTRDGGPRTIDAYLHKHRGRFKHFNYPRYTIDGRLAVDFIVRFEHFIPDLTKALGQVGLAFDGWLPKAKGHTRKDRRHYSEILNEEQRDIIAAEFASEIDLLHYQFEDRRAVA